MRRSIAVSLFLLGVGATPGTAVAGTYILQPVLLCNPGHDLCGFSSAAAFDAWMLQVTAEMNLEYRDTVVSYHPAMVHEIQDEAYADIDNPKGDPDENLKVVADLLETPWIGPVTIPIFFHEKNGSTKCWNGIPSPDELPGFGGDDAVFCPVPSMNASGNPIGANSMGRTLAHELGHFWGLKHTHTGEDPVKTLLIDRDGDDCVDENGVPKPNCFVGWDIEDTPADPKPFESDDGVFGAPKQGHEWCETAPYTADPGSPHVTYCEPACYRMDGGTLPTFISEFPETANAMSYYRGCKGPVVVGGETTEAISIDQAENIAKSFDQVKERAALYDRCASHGGDDDHDGWCLDEDLCPTTPDVTQEDKDGDGLAASCDTCPDIWNAGDGDADFDDIGDKCDNDGDNDGIPDSKDGCVFSETDAGTCDEPPVYETPWLDFCRYADCEDLVLKIVPPCDPLAEWTFDDVRILGGAVYVHALPGQSLRETARALAGELPAPLSAEDDGERAVVLASKRDGKVVATLMEYSVKDEAVKVGEIGSEGLLRIVPTEKRYEVSALWSLSDDGSLDDSDRDGVPDVADTCLEVADPDQADADGDGYGDACDADLDQDGRIGKSDLVLVEECVGFDLTNPGYYGTCDDEPESLPVWSDHCFAADLNQDLYVDETDYAAVKKAASVGTPGPSLRAR